MFNLKNQLLGKANKNLILESLFKPFLALKKGDIIQARILQVQENNVIIAWKGEKVEVQTEVPLEEGTQVTLSYNPQGKNGKPTLQIIDKPNNPLGIKVKEQMILSGFRQLQIPTSPQTLNNVTKLLPYTLETDLTDNLDRVLLLAKAKVPLLQSNEEILRGFWQNNLEVTQQTLPIIKNLITDQTNKTQLYRLWLNLENNSQIPLLAEQLQEFPTTSEKTLTLFSLLNNFSEQNHDITTQINTNETYDNSANIPINTDNELTQPTETSVRAMLTNVIKELAGETILNLAAQESQINTQYMIIPLQIQENWYTTELAITEENNYQSNTGNSRKYSLGLRVQTMNLANIYTLITLEDNKLKIKFALENQAALTTIEEYLPELKQALESADIQVADITAQLGSHQNSCKEHILDLFKKGSHKQLDIRV